MSIYWLTILLATVAAITSAGVNAQCPLPEYETGCDDFEFRVVDGCFGSLFFGAGVSCCDCTTRLPGTCGLFGCRTDAAFAQMSELCLAAGGDPTKLGNGFCAPENNIEECVYDAGDCCACDCNSSTDTECGSNGYNCVNPNSRCVGATSEPEAQPTPEPIIPIQIQCIEPASVSAPDGVVDQISIDTTWQVVSGEHDSHKSALQVNEERTSSGAFVDASFYGDFDLGATVSGSPTTVVVFGVRAFDVAGNSDACVFYMGIVPEEDTAPAPAPVLPWWEYTAEPASAPVLPWWDYTPEPVEAPVDNAPSPVSPPITPSEAPLPAGTEEPTQSPVATGPAPPEAPLPTPSPVDVEEPVAPTPTAPEEQEPGVDDVDEEEEEEGGEDSEDTDYVEAGTKTTVDVTASGYDDRPGQSGDNVGCGEDGCLPDLAHDGIGEEDVESRWSCAEDIVPHGGQCEIEFTFGSPQNIVDVQVAFWKGDERTRTLKVSINGDKIGDFESQSGSTVTSLGISEGDVRTITLESIGINKDEWISLLEVRFMVEP